MSNTKPLKENRVVKVETVGGPGHHSTILTILKDGLVEPYTLKWDKSIAGQEVGVDGPTPFQILMPENPTPREVEDLLIRVACVDIFLRDEEMVDMVMEHRLLADRGSARGGRCADLYRLIRYSLSGSKNWTETLAIWGDRQAIKHLNEELGDPS